MVKHKEVLSATLFSFLSDVNSSLCCVAVDCLMALVDLTGLMSEKEVSPSPHQAVTLVVGGNLEKKAYKVLVLAFCLMGVAPFPSYQDNHNNNIIIFI